MKTQSTSSYPKHKGISSEKIHFYNDSGEIIPALAMMKITGTNVKGAFTVAKPDGDNLANVLINGDVDVPYGGYSCGWENGTHPCLITTDGEGNYPVEGDYIGSKDSSWEAMRVSNGTHQVRKVKGDNTVALVFASTSPGGTISFCKIVRVGASQVLKKCLPSAPTTLTDFEKSISDVREGISGKTLLAAAYPDDTFIVVFADSSGEYFVHPFAQWRP